jgi:hypothetical protein
MINELLIAIISLLAMINMWALALTVFLHRVFASSPGEQLKTVAV